jgi:hypothetical protein
MPLSQPGQNIPNKNIPVLLTIFNRPEKTKMVIDNLRQVKPNQVYIFADGPRMNHPTDQEKCSFARQTATKNIDWPCEIETWFLEDNMGVDPAVSTAIDWFFQHVEYGIIIEDDCLLHPDFFNFCGDLFKRYLNDLRVMQISSLSPYEKREHPYDYHFSRAFRCSGGWGTWRRAWKHYTYDMRIYENNEALSILTAYNSDYSYCFYKYQKLMEFKKKNFSGLKRCSDDYYDHWDYQWQMACAAQNSLCIVPEINLMENIGFDEESTHTVIKGPVFDKKISVHPLTFPLRHPVFVYADDTPEKGLEKEGYNSMSFKSRFYYILRRVIGAAYYFYTHSHMNFIPNDFIFRILKL